VTLPPASFSSDLRSWRPSRGWPESQFALASTAEAAVLVYRSACPLGRRGRRASFIWICCERSGDDRRPVSSNTSLRPKQSSRWIVWSVSDSVVSASWFSMLREE